MGVAKDEMQGADAYLNGDRSSLCSFVCSSRKKWNLEKRQVAGDASTSGCCWSPNQQPRRLWENGKQHINLRGAISPGLN